MSPANPVNIISSMVQPGDMVVVKLVSAWHLARGQHLNLHQATAALHILSAEVNGPQIEVPNQTIAKQQPSSVGFWQHGGCGRALACLVGPVWLLEPHVQHKSAANPNQSAPPAWLHLLVARQDAWDKLALSIDTLLQQAARWQCDSLGCM